MLRRMPGLPTTTARCRSTRMHGRTTCSPSQASRCESPRTRWFTCRSTRHAGIHLTYYDWNWADAEKSFSGHWLLNPNDATQRHRYSRYLASLGRLEEALKELERARLLDPLDLVIKANVGVIHYFARHTTRPSRSCKRLARPSRFSTAHWGLGLAHEQKGSYQQALPEMEKASERRGANSLASLGHLYGVMGRKQQANEILAELRTRARKENISGYQIALVHIGLGETEEAMERCSRPTGSAHALELHLRWIHDWTRYETTRTFQELLKRIGLAQ